MKNWENKIVDETIELFDLFFRLHAHEKAIERIRERIVYIENSIYQQRPKDYIETVLNFMIKKIEILHDLQQNATCPVYECWTTSGKRFADPETKKHMNTVRIHTGRFCK
ncbi:MAG: hypothetical protein C4548_01225 [Desulfobacteraceae bacterium]|jgi:hypothetical protein|nr:MAG: hypothetical protein C4548_01225 [Desulfobacteraceae bacterium]